MPEIIVNYVGEHTTNSPIKLPHFTSRTRNPPEFLEQFNKYYEHYTKRNSKECLGYLELIEQCFENTTAMWFQIIKHDLKDIEDFKNKFLKQFWSQDVQRNIKKRIEVEKYRNDGKLSMTEYFIDRVLTLKSMLPPMEDLEIIDLLANNFNEQIRISIAVQNVQTFERFMEILNREEMHLKTEQTRHNLNQSKYTNSPQRSNTNHYTQRDNKNEGYQRYNQFVPHLHHPYKNNNPNSRDNKNQHNYRHEPYGYRQNTPYTQQNQHSKTYGQNQNYYRRHDNRQPEVQSLQFDHSQQNKYPTAEQTAWLRQLPQHEIEGSRRQPNLTEHNQTQNRTAERRQEPRQLSEN